MTGTIKIFTNIDGTNYSVDLSKNNCSVQYSYNNPLVVFPLPSVTASDPAASPVTNQIIIDIKMASQKYLLTFDLTDGIEASSDFWKLQCMCQMPLTNPIYFTWGTLSHHVTIESLTMGTRPGHLDYLSGCTMTLAPNIM